MKLSPLHEAILRLVGRQHDLSSVDELFGRRGLEAIPSRAALADGLLYLQTQRKVVSEKSKQGMTLWGPA